MKRYVAMLLTMMIFFSMTVCAAAEGEVFDPCANLWYWDYAEFIYTYNDGTVVERYIDYSLPQNTYAVFEYRADGTFTQTSTTAFGETYTYDGVWEKISDTQIQITETVADEEVITIIEYKDGVMVEASSEPVGDSYYYEGVTVYSDDPDGSIREAMTAYQIDDNMDANADESVFRKDFIMYGFLDYTLVYYYGFEKPSLTAMDPYANEGNWYGSITWMDDETVSFKLNTNGDLFDVSGTCKPTMASSGDGVPLLLLEVTDEATGAYYPIVLIKHADRELYRVQFLTDNGIEVYFQAVPAEIYN